MARENRIIKKYSNRRLYDTQESRYITLDELAKAIRGGDDVQVVDAKSGEDLTQATLVQIVLESRGAAQFLPVPLLTQMIRMEDEALAEFMSAHITYALDMFQQTRKGFKSMASVNPYFVSMLDSMQRGMGMDWLPRWTSQGPPWKDGILSARDERKRTEIQNLPKDFERSERPDEPRPDPAPPEDEGSETQDLREELNELKSLVRDLISAKSSESN